MANYKKWDNFKLHCTSITKVLANATGYNDVTKNQATKLAKILLQETKSEDDLLHIEYCKERRENYLNSPLSAGCKNHLIERFLNEKYGLSIVPTGDRYTPSILKGVALEPLAVQILSRVDKIDYECPQEAKSNDFITGKPDIFCHDSNNLIDIKISWNAASFAKLHIQKLTSQIYGQLQGYMEIYGFEEAEACYLLLNTPEYFIEQKKKEIAKKFVEGVLTRGVFDEKMNELGDFFDYEKKIPEHRRIIRYVVKKDNEFIERVNRKVVLCREFLNGFERTFAKNNKILTLAEDYKKKSKLTEDSEEDNPEPDTPDTDS